MYKCSKTPFAWFSFLCVSTGIVFTATACQGILFIEWSVFCPTFHFLSCSIFLCLKVLIAFVSLHIICLFYVQNSFREHTCCCCFICFPSIILFLSYSISTSLDVLFEKELCIGEIQVHIHVFCFLFFGDVLVWSVCCGGCVCVLLTTHTRSMATTFVLLDFAELLEGNCTREEPNGLMN